MLLGILGASLLGNLLTSEKKKEQLEQVKPMLEQVKTFPSHSLTHSEIQKYYQKEPKFNSA